MNVWLQLAYNWNRFWALILSKGKNCKFFFLFDWTNIVSSKWKSFNVLNKNNVFLSLVQFLLWRNCNFAIPKSHKTRKKCNNLPIEKFSHYFFTWNKMQPFKTWKYFARSQKYAAQTNERVNPINFITFELHCLFGVAVCMPSTNRCTNISLNVLFPLALCRPASLPVCSRRVWFWVIYACLIIFPLSLLSTHCSLSCQVATKTGAFTWNTQMICNLFCIITIQSDMAAYTVPNFHLNSNSTTVFKQNLLNTINFIAEMQFIVIKSLLKWNICGSWY